PPAANNLAYLMLQHGLDLDVALSLAESARRGMPDSPQAGDTLGWAYYHKGIYGSARTQLEDAVRLEPGKADYHYHLGLTYVKLGDKAKGRAELERALQIDPGLAKSTDVRDVLAQIAHK
ncbi:MAG TPA: tetratricopeptide repeat protein, partial [Terriglobia bacterium]|nr:tetratricopeptide repeat protein [Terriglobia bacterium]